MDLKIFKDMDRDQLQNYLEFLLWHYRVVDAFWFLRVAERYDQPTAESINEEVWAKVSAMAAKDLLGRFAVADTGLKGFVKALKLFPWCILVGYHIQEQPDRVTLTVPDCPTQQARLRRGLGEYVCKDMHRREFEEFARVVDARIRVQCDFAPPDPHPADQFCRWQFWIEADETAGRAG